MTTKKIQIIVLLIAIILITIGIWLVPKKASNPNLATINATIDSKAYKLYAPKTTAEQQRGLAIFDYLANEQGMIFRGNPVGVQGVWMKDMKFNIDIIWVDKDNRIIHLVKNASKDSYPTIFQNPDSTASAYIIELSAGQLDAQSIKIGDEVRILP